MSKITNVVAALVVSLTMSSVASASVITTPTSLSGNSYIDDEGWIAISTNDSVQGTIVASNNDWRTAADFSGFTLLTGVDYFIHIYVMGGEYPNNVIGEFNIDGASHEFVNGTQKLGTNKDDWLWGTSLSNMVNTPFNVGNNYAASFDATTENIFRANTWPNYRHTSAYFTTKISVVQPEVTSVPEPSIIALFTLGLFGIGFARRRQA
jgi:hypothetical protein